MERENTKADCEMEPHEAELMDTGPGEGSTQRDSRANKASSLEESDKKEGGEEVGKLSSLRVNQLSRFLRHQQEVVYKQEHISKHFPPDIQKVATKCWDQIHPNIPSAIEEKYSCVLEEWHVTDKLIELDRQPHRPPTSLPAWRPTGLPVEDCLTAESAEASAVLPDFETKLTEVQALSSDLEQQLREREEEKARLEQEIATYLDNLKQKTAPFPQATPTQ